MVDDKLTVSELMTTSMIALPPVVPVRRLVDTLRMCNHQVRCAAWPLFVLMLDSSTGLGQMTSAGGQAGLR